jgi:hypothetical protein
MSLPSIDMEEEIWRDVKEQYIVGFIHSVEVF